MPTAYLCCPAHPLADGAQVDAARARAAPLCAALGWRLELSPLLGRHPGTGAWLPVQERAEDLRRGLGCEALIAARGGYGCIELAEVLTAHPGPWPVVVGYSDLTVVHAAAWRAGAFAGVYGFMPGVNGGSRAPTSALGLLSGAGLTLGSGDGGLPIRPGCATGRLFPACLRVLTGLVGTSLMPDLRGALLALEDVDERPYRTDRDLHQLWRSGALAGIAGLILGRFPCDLPDAYAGPRIDDLAAAWADRLQVPTVVGVPFGHERDPISLPVGRVSTLEVRRADWILTATPDDHTRTTVGNPP